MSLRKLLGGVFSSITSKNRYRIYLSIQIAENILRGMEDMERAQDRFARAMSQYAEQLKRHTSAIEGLSKASNELAKSAVEQHNFLTRLARLIEQPSAGVEEQIISKPKEEIKVKNVVYPPPGCYKRRLLQNKDKQLISM